MTDLYRVTLNPWLIFPNPLALLLQARVSKVQPKAHFNLFCCSCKVAKSKHSRGFLVAATLFARGSCGHETAAMTAAPGPKVVFLHGLESKASADFTTACA